MDFKLFFFYILIEFYAAICIAQNPSQNSPDDLTKDKVEDFAGQTDQEQDFSEITDELNFLKEHPVDLNTASKEDLQKLNLLNEIQLNNLLNYIKKNGKMVSLYELQSVDGFYDDLIQKIIPFLYLDIKTKEVKFNIKNVFLYGHHECYIRAGQLLQKQKGFITNDTTDAFLGSPQKYVAKYHFNYGKKISFGITTKKDAGEEFFRGSQKNGFDFYSMHLFYKNKGFLKSFALGDYIVQFGQGLTMWKGFSFMKTTDVMNIKKNAQGLKPYSSTNEYNFLRGAAAVFALNHIEMTFFYSAKKIDANMNVDEDSNQVISSLIEYPIHATLNDLKKQKNAKESILGCHVAYVYKKVNIGVTANQLKYDLSLVPQNRPDNQFEFSGKQHTGLGLDYSYLIRKVIVFGEFSHSLNAGSAMLHGIMADLTSSVSFSCLYRNYSKDFHPVLCKSFSENTSNENERGIFMGMELRPFSKLILSASVDYFTFPWLKYQVNAPSRGSDYIVQFKFNPSDELKLNFRFRQKTKQYNNSLSNTMIDYIENMIRQNYRFHLTYRISPLFYLQNRIEFVKNLNAVNETKQGWFFCQDVIYSAQNHPFKLILRYALFDCDTYDERIYSYENDIQYDYNLTSFYYKGYRFSIMAKFNLTKFADCQFKFEQIVYTNRNTIGSGNSQINSNVRSEIKLMVRVKL